ncbi:alanine/glycine:cation symporter family protein [Sedimentibacter saalensis]|jgi:AGCS family alanine or glycine:cation symporter|uniref:AGCS family alanine or glycine:cation symporter n=2 Tax=Sedimentibacter TaxID=190972 RepID=A0A562J5K2_9FIRM|nr:sodium:alanine symporter family protein [Sedimentibacter saalensis]MEA5094685.1 sodium:alanine symporter family protein [Sedimentibacter saalensis]TWH78436.1 AGCS family alanine or glycine:cation symporter [Sedimentibacter saalensis]
METIMNINNTINGIVWGPPILVLIVGAGLFLSAKTGFFSIFKLGYILKNTLLKMFSKENKGEGEVTAFQAVATALAATVGTGNIAGVATAIAAGGPGAVFWMWLAAILGMTTKFAEVVLAVNFREKTEDGRFVGGPMYYITNGLGWKWLAVLFALFGAFAAFGIGNMVQSNSVAAALQSSFNLNPWVTGIVLAVVTALVIIGGIKRIGAFTEKLVPFMAAIYILGGLAIIVINAAKIPAAFALIFSSAFTGKAAVGGFAGATISQAIRFGIARGVFTNEAGLGSAPIAHAAATTDHPVRQGLWGVFEVFADTLVICSITALAIVTSGVWESGATGAALTTSAFEQAIPGGGYIVSIGIVLFAFSTIVGWEYYGERCAEYLFGPKANMIYRIIWIPFVLVGAIGGLEFVWSLADTLNGLMAIPNLIGVLALSGTVFKLTKEFFAKEKVSK